MKIPTININDFDYPLSSERIAKYPLDNRDQSKLLVYNNQVITEQLFKDLPGLLPENTLLVFNNTKVIPARLHFYKSTGTRIEIFCLEPHGESAIGKAFEQTGGVEWHCLAGNLKKWKEGSLTREIIVDGSAITVKALMIKRMAESVIIRFRWNGPFSFAEILEAMGQTPIPPYLEREAEEIDTERYQTIYSKHGGSVAAPTAGLHFSSQVINSLSEKRIKTIELTLHVGAGTFKPVKSSSIDHHEMHSEHFSVPVETLEVIRDHDGPVIAVGTTTMRTLESLYLAGAVMAGGGECKHVAQWDGFRQELSMDAALSLETIINHLKRERLSTFEASTAVIIVPGFRFKLTNGLITNFHQPKSTLLLLIAALVGDKWNDIYRYALDNNFRFLSYGDSSLLLP